VSARGWPRETTEIYEEHYDTIWALIRDAHDGITSETYEPDLLDLITEEACPDCDYREMCADRLPTEVQR